VSLGPSRRVLGLLLAICIGGIPLLATSPPATRQEPNQLPYAPITSGNWDDVSPAWSPDGSLIAFSSDANGVWQILTIEPNGSAARIMTPSSYDSSQPSWSPDSASMAFLSTQGSRTDVRVAFIRNSTVVTVTNGTYSVLPVRPNWNPDGTHLLFFVDSNGTLLVSADVATGALQVVAPVAGVYDDADWLSPSEVIYSTLGQQGYEIDQMNLITRQKSVVVSGLANFTAPVVSLSTSKIAYVTNLIPPKYGPFSYPCAYQPGDYNLWVSDMDGSNATFQSAPVGEWDVGIIPYPAPYTPATISPTQSLAWSSDGNMIAYTGYSDLYGTCIYLWDVSISASSLGLLGPTNASSQGLTWSPDSVNLAFAAMEDGHFHVFVLNTTNAIVPMPVNILD